MSSNDGDASPRDMTWHEKIDLIVGKVDLDGDGNMSLDEVCKLSEILAPGRPASSEDDLPPDCRRLVGQPVERLRKLLAVDMHTHSAMLIALWQMVSNNGRTKGGPGSLDVILKKFEWAAMSPEEKAAAEAEEAAAAEEKAAAEAEEAAAAEAKEEASRLKKEAEDKEAAAAAAAASGNEDEAGVAKKEMYCGLEATQYQMDLCEQEWKQMDVDGDDTVTTAEMIKFYESFGLDSEEAADYAKEEMAKMGDENGRVPKDKFVAYFLPMLPESAEAAEAAKANAQV